MARFLVWSDLHDEFWEGFDLPDLSTPVVGVLIAGDSIIYKLPARRASAKEAPTSTDAAK